MYEIDSTLNLCNNNTVPVIQTLRKGARVSEKTFFGPGLKIRGEGGSIPQAPLLNPPLQQQVYSVLPFLYMVLPTEIQIINR